MKEENDSEGPIVDPDAWIAPSVQMFGKIRIAAGASVWYNAVLRAESHHISIGRMTNLQDFVMAHIGYASPTIIGDFCSITHHTTIHGCTIGDTRHGQCRGSRAHRCAASGGGICQCRGFFG